MCGIQLVVFTTCGSWGASPPETQEGSSPPVPGLGSPYSFLPHLFARRRPLGALRALAGP